MGATVTTGKLATAFVAPNGETCFVLFEQTYEKNVYPHTPRWHCVGMGSLSAVLERIFAYATGCEGGSLQSRSGCITPEGYIAGWLKELANPVAQSDLCIRLSQGSGFYSVVTDANRDSVCEAVRSLGRCDLADVIRAGSQPALQLHSDTDLVLALIDAGVLVWRLITVHAPVFGQRVPSLGYSPKPVRPSSDVYPAFLKVDAEERLVRRDDGAWVNAGWEYSIVQDFIRSLWTKELAEPGTYRKRIAAFRDAIRAAPRIPTGTRVVVDLSVPLEADWQRRDVLELREKVDASPTSTGYSFPLPADESLRYRACHLPRECTTWELPEAEPPVSPLREQLSLLPA